MKPQPIGVCTILIDIKKKSLLLGKRKNSYKAGYYGLPGGRIKLGEPTATAAIREVKEETGIKIEQIQFVGTIREYQQEKDFIHFAFLSTSFSGEPALCEPDKCEGWQWFPITKLPQQILPGHRLAIESYLSHQPFIDKHK